MSVLSDKTIRKLALEEKMIYARNTSINAKLAPIVKWYNMSMVRINFKFDSWWGHHTCLSLFSQSKNYQIL